MTHLRSLIAIVSALAGIGYGLTLTSACSSDCDCPAPRPITTGEFTVTNATLSSGAPDSLRDVEVTRLVVTNDAAVVHYTRGDEAGTATYTFGNKY